MVLSCQCGGMGTLREIVCPPLLARVTPSADDSARRICGCVCIGIPPFAKPRTFVIVVSKGWGSAHEWLTCARTRCGFA